VAGGEDRGRVGGTALNYDRLMAQPLTRDFLADLMRIVDMPDPVVEFGSMQVEPDQDGDLRSLFERRAFTGTDYRDGPGVDRIEDLRGLTYADGEVGTAICVDTLEHCADPPAACRELHRVVAEGGVCVIASVMAFGIHAYPSDYFRFTPEGFRSMLEGFDDVWVTGIGDPAFPVQVLGVGVKGRTLDLDLDKLPSLAAAQQRWDSSAGHVRIGPLMLSPKDAARALVTQAPRLLRERLRSRS
jgi:SAM-dependent methyltransferase